MDSQGSCMNAKLISFSCELLSLHSLLKNMVGKQICTFCKEKEDIHEGTLLSLSKNQIQLLTSHGEECINITNVLCFSSNENHNSFTSSEEILVPNKNNVFFKYIGKMVYAVSKYIPWHFVGTLIYIGKDFLTIRNENNTYFHLPLKQLRDLCNDPKKLRF